MFRLGFEKTGTPDWCDPFPPALWKGRRIMSRVNSNDKGIDSYDSNKCEWEEQELTYQCFGLGDERFSVVNKSRIATAEECQQACCGDESCGIWQHSPDRGCYYNKKSNQCMKSNNNYIGGRKCLNDFCSGLENTILPNYYKSLASRNITNNM